MDENLAPVASGGHGARWLPCHGYGTEGEKLSYYGKCRDIEGEVVDMVKMRGLDLCCLQENR